MSPENQQAMNAMAARVAAMPDAELDRLIQEDQCPYEPEHLIGVPLGMFHCPLCGEMVVAGIDHPRERALTEEDWKVISGEWVLVDNKPTASPLFGAIAFRVRHWLQFGQLPCWIRKQLDILAS